jgi:hypothetical protein
LPCTQSLLTACRPWAGPSGIAPPLARAGWRPVGPDARRCRAGATAFRALDFCNGCISLLLLADNYIWELRTKPQRHEGTKDAQRGPRQISCLAILAGLCAAMPGSHSLVAALPGSRLYSWPAARGPDLPRLRHCHLTGLNLLVRMGVWVATADFYTDCFIAIFLMDW